MLSAAELTAIREAIEDLLPDTCHILSKTLTNDGSGGQSAAWGTATASVACRLDPINGVESQVGGVLQPYHSYTLTLPHGTTIKETYRVKMGTRLFAVSSVDDSKSWQASVRCQVEEEDPDA